MEGMRPVIEIMWGDFLLVALDQLINQAANVRFINRSALHAPMVLRYQQGATPGACAQHSQSLEAFLTHVPAIGAAVGRLTVAYCSIGIESKGIGLIDFIGAIP